MAFEQGASDLTADFLQREKQAAGVLLGDDEALFGAPSAGEHDFERRAREFPALDDDGAFEAALSKSHDAPAGQPVPVTSDEDHFRASYPDMDAPVSGLDVEDAQHAWEATAPRMQKETLYELERDVPAPAPEAEPAPPVTEPVDVGPTPFTYEALDEETEALRSWRERQADDVARREAQAERERAEAVSRAEREMDEFYDNYRVQKEKNIKKNKEDEAQFQQQRQAELAEGTTWTRITKLLDLQHSQSKTIAKGGAGSSDLTRMKDLYLRLRREGEMAPGAAGY